MPAFDRTGVRVGIRRPVMADCDEFLSLISSSENLSPWVAPPSTPERFLAYVSSRQGHTDDGFLICAADSKHIMGVINLNCIVRGFLQSAYLGYYIGGQYARQGYMSEGLSLVVNYAFTEMALHRVEANIQPTNLASIALVRKLGFRKEGFSPRYLQVAGKWQDHERWALLCDDARK
jgi:ribosomal-protein-alanine N-acetyltransferase